MTGLFTGASITGRAASAMIAPPTRKGSDPVVPVTASTAGPSAKPIDSSVA